jgi:hypothetical protein
MPSITQRDSILNDIRKLLLLMILNEQDSTDEFEELVILHYQINNTRVLDPGDPIPKNHHGWLLEKLNPEESNLDLSRKVKSK